MANRILALVKGILAIICICLLFGVADMDANSSFSYDANSEQVEFIANK